MSGRHGTITVPRAVIGLLVVALLAALLVVAYLLGRDAGRAERATAAVEPVVAPETPTASPAARAETPTRPPTRPEPRPTRPASPGQTTETAADPPATTPSPPPAPAAPSGPRIDPQERTAVARYLDEIDRLSSTQTGVGNPDAMAQALLSQATSGDWRQFDELGDTQREMVRQLRRVRVPATCADCRDYHEKMVEMFETGASLLDEVKDGVQSGNLGALGTLATTAQHLQSDAESARRLAVAIQTRYGL